MIAGVAIAKGRLRLSHEKERDDGDEASRATPNGPHQLVAGTFAVGAAMPLMAVGLAPGARLIPIAAATSLVFLAILGGLAALAGGASATLGAARVTFWGALAMALTAGIGALFGTVV